jgi:hypothetical protein
VVWGGLWYEKECGKGRNTVLGRLCYEKNVVWGGMYYANNMVCGREWYEKECGMGRKDCDIMRKKMV